MKRYKSFFTVILICFLSKTEAQIYKLDYQFNNYIAIFNKTKTLDATLEYDSNNKKSLYTVFKINENSKNERLDDNTFVLGSNNIDNELVYSNFKTSDMVIQEQIDIEMMNFTEKIPAIKWNLVNESKTENNLKLNKATTSFRGRNYTVWYTLDIPINAGPWKLNGLPGAIVKVDEDKGRYSWVLKSYQKIEKSDIKSPLENNEYVVKNIKEYPKLKFEIPPRIIEKLNKIDPNGYTPKPERIDLELLFEWEN